MRFDLFNPDQSDGQFDGRFDNRFSEQFGAGDFIPAGICFVAAAVIGGAALTTGATMFGASKAASAQTSAANAATAAQKEMFGLTKEQLQPFIEMGKIGYGPLASFINRDNPSSPLNALMRLTMPGADMSAALAETPGFKFTEDRGLRSVNNALAARGLGGSGGAVAKGAAEYTTGLAQGTWKDVVDRLMNTFSGGAGALQNIVNTGAGSAAALGGNATQVGGQIGSNLIGMGNAQAGANMATANAIGGLGSSIPTALLWQQMLGKGGATPSASGLYESAQSSAYPWAG